MYLYGAGGHAKVIADAVTLNGGEIQGIIDDNPDAVEFLGHRVRHQVGDDVDELIVSIGDNHIRRKIVDKLGKRRYGVAIHPRACVSPSAKIGEGTVVMAGAVVQADAVIGRHCIINTGATVDHDCVVGDFVHISPGVSLCGAVSVGDGSHVGVGTKIVPGKHVGKGVMVCAGSIVSKDVPDYCMAAGAPCRKVKSLPESD